jgi:saccharopine dehydrogenase-like NADP-dependent oxidoreductase
MKVLVLGAGGQGGPCASILARDKEITEIVLADMDLAVAERVKAKVGGDKMKAIKVNAVNQEEVITAAKGMDVIIDMMPVWLGPSNMKAACKAGIQYVSTSFDEPYLDQIANGEELYLDKELKEAGVTALMGCGYSPGFANVLVRNYTDQLDTVKSIKIRLGKKKVGLPPFADITAPWNPGWSPKQALLDFSNPCYVFRNGKFESLPPFSEIEDYPFDEPVGNMLVSHHTHEEVCSLPVVIKKGIEYCDFKYYVARQAATFYGMGMASKEPVDIGGCKIAPIDFVMKFVPHPGNAFFDEKYEGLDELDRTLFVPMDLLIEGTKDGKDVHYKIICPKLTAPGKKLYDLFGTSMINVALPAVIGAKMILKEAKGGIMFAEQLNPTEFLDRFLATGFPYKWKVEMK